MDFLATLATRLEQQVEVLERQHLFSAAEPGDHLLPNLILRENEGDFDELRRALEKFLAKNPDLLKEI